MQTREQVLRKYAKKNDTGLEIGPLINGICRKSDGYNVLIYDICTTYELIEYYKDKTHKVKELP